ncbi:MAG: hypothetical protein KDA92_12495 [Planctomycetales bacterium]|nr:hypothetical protein [Planctomycetales bacterium]
MQSSVRQYVVGDTETFNPNGGLPLQLGHVGLPDNYGVLMHAEGVPRVGTYGLAVASPPDGTHVTASPNLVLLNFDSPIRLDTLSLDDILYDGVPVRSYSVVNSSSIRVVLGPGSGDGPAHVLSISPNSILDVSGRPNDAIRIVYTIDSEAPRIAEFRRDESVGTSNARFIVTFDEPVEVIRGPIAYHQGTGRGTTARMTEITPNQYLATFSLSVEGAYSLVWPATSVTDTVGNALDGEANDTFPTGNGTAGGDFQDLFYTDVTGPITPRLLPVANNHAAIYSVPRLSLFLGPDDADTVNVRLDENDMLGFKTAAVNDVAYDVAVQAPGGNIVALYTVPSGGSLNGVYVVEPGVAAGDYSIVVTSSGGSVGTVLLDLLQNAAFDQEPNEPQPTAQELQFVNLGTGPTRASVASDDTESWYRFKLNGGQLAHVMLTNVTGNGTASLEIYDANLALISSRSMSLADSDNYQVLRDLGAEGTTNDYYLHVTTSNAARHYLTVTRDAVNVGINEPLTLGPFNAVAGAFAFVPAPTRFSANEGDPLVIRYQSILSPTNPASGTMRLLDPTGQVVQSTSIQGASPQITHTATMTGDYVLLLDVTDFEYLISVEGRSTGTAPFEVVHSTIADGQYLNTQPGAITLTLPSDLRLDLVALSSISLNGASLDSVNVEGNRIEIQLPTLAEQAYHLELAPGSLTSIFGDVFAGVTFDFVYDVTAPSVIQSSLEPNTTLTNDRLDVTVQFDELLDAASINAQSLRLVGNFGAIAPDSFEFDASTFTLTAAFQGLIDDDYELRLSNELGAGPPIVDLAGNRLAALTTPLTINLGSVPYDGLYMPIAPTQADLTYLTEPRQFALSSDTDVDTRVYRLHAGQTVTARFSRVDAGTKYAVTVRDPQGQVVATLAGDANAADNLAATFSAEASGDYSFEVAGADGTAPGRVSLRLELNLLPERVDANLPPNNVQSQAEDLDAVVGVAGVVTVAIPAATNSPQHWFSFTVADGESFSIGFAGSQGSVQLIGPDSQLIAFGSTALVNSQTFSDYVDKTTNGQPDRYWILVDTQQANGPTFRLSLRRNVALEHQNSDSVLSNLRPLAGQLSTRDTDHYQISANAGDVLSIDVAPQFTAAGAPGETWRAVARLISPTGEEVASQALGANDPTSFTYTVTAAGEYRLEITGADELASGDYLVSVSGSTVVPVPTVVESFPADEGIASRPRRVRLTFDMSLDLSTIDVSKFTLNGVAFTGFAPYDANTIMFDIDPALLAGTPDTVHTFIMQAGAAQGFNGQAVGEYTIHFQDDQRVSGDINGDGQLNWFDLDSFCADFRANDFSALDVDGDGQVGHDDFFALFLALGSRPGDVNEDGRFTTDDFVQVFIRGKYEQDVDATWRDGDLNCDGRFTSRDFVLAFQFGELQERAASPAATSAATLAELAIVDADDKRLSRRNA